MAELADAQDLGSCVFGRKGSSPFTRTANGVFVELPPSYLRNPHQGHPGGGFGVRVLRQGWLRSLCCLLLRRLSVLQVGVVASSDLVDINLVFGDLTLTADYTEFTATLTDGGGSPLPDGAELIGGQRSW